MTLTLLTNPLAAPSQLLAPTDLPKTLTSSLLWASSALLQSSGTLLQLPQPTIATSIVLLHRFYLITSFSSFPPLHTVHAVLFLSSKLTETPTKLRAIINATAYLLSTPSPSPISPESPPTDPNAHYVEESRHSLLRTKLLDTEAEVLKALAFQTHCALPYTPLVNYAQVLEVLDADVVKAAVGRLNDGLLAPGRVYLTCQPNAIAVAALYIAARECGRPLPERWWEVFDVDREELGFLVVSLLGVEGFCVRMRERWKVLGGVPWEGGRELEELMKRVEKEEEDEEER